MTARLRAWWTGAGTDVRALVVLLPIGLVAAVGLTIWLTTPSAPVTSRATPSPSAQASIPSPGQSPVQSPTASAPPTPAPTEPPDELLGLDGRFTLLLLGSDYRPSNPGNRTDTIMIVSVLPADGSLSAVSIPRDTARFPLPNGTIYGDKVNGLYQRIADRLGRDAAGPELGRAVGAALGVEIDAYAFIGLGGVVALIDAIGGVDVVLDKSVNDPYYWVNSHTRGVYFPAGRNHFDGARALIFARTRKGDTDWDRAARQQQLVLATMGRVLDRGTAKLPGLVEVGLRYVRTDLPLDEAAAVFRLLQAADIAGAKGVVLGPPTYARHIAGGTDYELKMDVVRALVAKLFAPAPGSPITQTASPAP